ncbi:vigilin [Nephila pilipes]|uniref:Vigilin n=1 Tax=Nephila pilipes TaxID=299642 RepID=A0A8X6NAC4_NEPPI|nr:vigilin [Nephila pilipes]
MVKRELVLKKVRNKTKSRIIFPNENDDNKNTIIIIGRKEEVEAAKYELNSLIIQLKDAAEAIIEIDPKHHRYFVTRGAEVLKQTSNDYGDATVSFPKIGSNSSKQCHLEDQMNPGGPSYVVPDRRSRSTSATCRRLWKQTKQQSQLLYGHESEDDQER